MGIHFYIDTRTLIGNSKMMTLEQAIDFAKNNDDFDSRFGARLCQFLTADQVADLGFEFSDDEARNTHIAKEWSRDAVIEQLKKDVEFGFEKALDQRGISAGLMASVVQCWNAVLQEGLEGFDEYPMYGLPIFRATAVKYGFDNPIGDDFGNEEKYNE